MVIPSRNQPVDKLVCLVGCGSIGRTHARNFRGRVRLSFCSGRPANARAFQRQFKGEGVYESYDDVLDDPAVDAVILATPPALHRDQVVAALQAGKGVLVEKPMCVSAAEVEAITAAAQAHPEPVLMVAENYYYRATLHYIKERLAEQCLGPLVAVSVKKLSEQTTAGWKSHCGALLEGGVHMVALISDVVDAEPETVSAEFPDAGGPGPERHSRTRMEYAGGVVAHLDYSWSTPSLTSGIFQHSWVQGEAGRIVFETNGLYAWVNTAVTPRQLFLPLGGDVLGYRDMALDFVRCLEHPGQRPYSDLARARRDLGIVFKAYESNMQKEAE